MKRRSFWLSCLLTAVLVWGSVCPVRANSAQVYKEGLPGAETYVLEEDSPITVTREVLTFDLTGLYSSDESNGQVTAVYEMVNTSDEPRKVRMLFPFSTRLFRFSEDMVTIKAGFEELSYELYIGDSQEEDTLDLQAVLEAVSWQQSARTDLQGEAVGIWYELTWSYKGPTPEVPREPELSVSFRAEWGEHLISGLSGYSYDAKTGEGCARDKLWKSGEATLFFLDPDTEITAAALCEEEDVSSAIDLRIRKREMTLNQYLHNCITERLYGGSWEDARYFVMEDSVQRRDMLRRVLLDEFLEGSQSPDVEELFHGNGQQVLAFLYEVEFPAGASVTTSVSYPIAAEMDARETEHPLWNYRYFLSPAAGWKEFSDLEIRVLPYTPPVLGDQSEAVPYYMVESSLDFTRLEDGTYVAEYEKLPETELTFSMYKEETVTAKSPGASSGSFLRWLLPALGGGLLVGLGAAGAVVGATFLKNQFGRKDSDL